MIDVLDRRKPLGNVCDLWLDKIAFITQLVAGDLDDVVYVKASRADNFGGYQPWMRRNVISRFNISPALFDRILDN